MNTINGMRILEFRSLYEYTISSLFHILVGGFKMQFSAELKRIFFII